MSTTNQNQKIEFGEKDVLTDEDFKNPKVRISMMLDESIILAFKKMAAEQGEPYQALMRKALSESLKKPGQMKVTMEEIARSVFREEFGDRNFYELFKKAQSMVKEHKKTRIDRPKLKLKRASAGHGR